MSFMLNVVLEERVSWFLTCALFYHLNLKYSRVSGNNYDTKQVFFPNSSKPSKDSLNTWWSSRVRAIEMAKTFTKRRYINYLSICFSRIEVQGERNNTRGIWKPTSNSRRRNKPILEIVQGKVTAYHIYYLTYMYWKNNKKNNLRLELNYDEK